MHIDLEDRIRRAAGPPPPPPDVDALWVRGKAWRRRRRMLAVGSVVAAVVVAVVGPMVVFDRPTATPIVADPGAEVPQGPGSWERLPGAPISGRSEHGMVWTGREAIVWGGRDQLTVYGDGAAFDPNIGTWRLLPDAPIGPRAEHAMVWTGRHVFVWGGDGHEDGPLADGAVYDPSADTWRDVPQAPLAPARTPVAVWTGAEVIVLAASDAQAGDYEGGWPAAAFDPATWAWRRIEPAPIRPAWFATINVVDDQVIVLGGRDMQGGMPSRVGSPPPEPLTGAIYDLSTGAWQAYEWPELTQTSGAVAAWTGQRLLYFGGFGSDRATVALPAYDPAEDRWVHLADGPISGQLMAGVWTGAELLVWGNTVPDGPEGAAYHATSDSWTPLAPSGLAPRSHPTGVWTGSHFIVWGGLLTGGIQTAIGDGAAYQPGVPATNASPQAEQPANPCFDEQVGFAAARSAGTLNEPVASYQTDDDTLGVWLGDPPPGGGGRTNAPTPDDGIDDGPAWLCWYDGAFQITARDGPTLNVDRIAVIVQTDDTAAVVLGGRARGPNGGSLEAKSPAN